MSLRDWVVRVAIIVSILLFSILAKRVVVDCSHIVTLALELQFILIYVLLSIIKEVLVLDFIFCWIA